MEDSTKNEVLIKKANDHWAFLEDIEAPMWADLTLEANFDGDDVSDDNWFNTSHPFHRWSAHQLKSKFSHPGEEVLISGLASPELPSSVSRSRGKHYKSKKWEGTNLNVLLDKQQGLGRICFQAGSSFGQEVKPKSKSTINQPKGFLNGKLGLASERNARGKAKSMASFSNPVRSSTCVDNKASGSTTRSTITSENTLQQHRYKDISSQPCAQKGRSSTIRTVSLGKGCVTKKVLGVQRQQKDMEVSSQPCDPKTGSSLVTSVSLRKSYVTGEASGVEIGGDSMRSRGRKSSSGKSSVGSCSNSGYEVKLASKQQREKIPAEKDVVTMNLADKEQRTPGYVSNISTVTIEEAKSGNRKGRKVNFANPAYHRTAKSLVQYQSIRSKALLPSKVNIENGCSGAMEKPRTSKVSSLTGKGKENAKRNVTANQKCTERGVHAGSLLKHRITDDSCLQKGDAAGSTALTKLAKDPDQRGAKNRIDVARRVYLR